MRPPVDPFADLPEFARRIVWDTMVSATEKPYNRHASHVLAETERHLAHMAQLPGNPGGEVYRGLARLVGGNRAAALRLCMKAMRGRGRAHP